MKSLKNQLWILFLAAGLTLSMFSSGPSYAATRMPQSTIPDETATNYFVTQGGTGESCTPQDPCGSIQQAIDIADAGDIVQVGAGTFVENVTIPPGNDGLRLLGRGSALTTIVSAGGNPEQEAPLGVPVDIVLDIFSPDVKVRKLSIVHPPGTPTKRDVGIFVRPPAVNAVFTKLHVSRLRTGENLEPTIPGSRGVLVFRATGSEFRYNMFSGNYEDHIHLPTSASTVVSNFVLDATRLGIVVIQESATSLSVDNVIRNNAVLRSGSDGIQVQGDNSIVKRNLVISNGGFGIHLCGAASSPACVPPGSAAEASNNLVKQNVLHLNALGNITDSGIDNAVTQEGGATTDREAIGTVEAMPDEDTMRVNGQNYVLTAATQRDTAAGAVTVGALVHVTSYSEDDGSEVATQVRTIAMDNYIMLPMITR